MQKKIKKYGTAVVVANFAVNLLHGQAHQKLGVDTFDWPGNLFIYVVIITAPVIAMILLWTRFYSVAIWLLLGSMTGSLIFGAYNHFIAVTPDHVSHLPPGEAQTLFRITAILLVSIEALGGWIAWRAISERRHSTAPV